MMARVAEGAALPPKLLAERLTLLDVVSVVASAAMACRSWPINGGMELAKAVGRDGGSWSGSAIPWRLSVALMVSLM